MRLLKVQGIRIPDTELKCYGTQLHKDSTNLDGDATGTTGAGVAIAPGVDPLCSGLSTAVKISKVGNPNIECFSGITKNGEFYFHSINLRNFTKLTIKNPK